MNRAAMRHLQKPIFQFGQEAMRKLSRNLDLTHSMRVLSHGPFRFYAQPLVWNIATCAQRPAKVDEATCDGSSAHVDWVRADILADVSHRPIRPVRMLSTEIVVTPVAMI